MSGLINYKLLLRVLLGLCVLYVIVRFAPPYVTYFQLRYMFGEQARVAGQLSDEQLQEQIKQKLTEYPAELSIDHVVISRENDGITISAQYDVVIHHPWGSYTVLRFAPEGGYRKQR